MLTSAWNLLNEEYAKNLKRIPESGIYRIFCDEKIRHSAQVLGAANYILKHDAFFAKQDSEFIKTAKTAALLHDIARFDEAFNKFKFPEKTYNHSREGAKILSNIKVFAHPQISLPVKYHGDIYIAPLYEDPDYIKQPPEIRIQIDKIAKLVRDADKIANLHLFYNSREHMEKLVLSGFIVNQLKNKSPSEKIMQDFKNEKLLKTPELTCRSERLLQLIAWVFDLNFQSSAQFCEKLNLFTKMISAFNENCESVEIQEIVANKLKNYIFNNYQITVKG